MGLFDFLKKKGLEFPELDVEDDDIVAPADGELVDITTVSDEMFSQQMLGTSCAFHFPGKKVVVCAPANGTLCELFHTGHAFGVQMKDDTELLIHIGVNTVETNGDGFKLVTGKKKGDVVSAGEPIVEVDLAKLSAKYDMSTMIIVTDSSRDFQFASPKEVTRGDSVLK